MTEQLPIWRAPGVEPPEDLKNNGWQPGMKPSAQHINWLFNQLSILATESGVTVEDILTSTSSVNALSAKQGKVLKDLIDTKANDRDLTLLQEKTTQHLAQYEYQTATITGTQIQLMRQSNSNRLLFKLEAELIGDITVSTDAGATSKNLVDIDGVQVTSIEKGFHEIVQTGNFFIIRNKGGLSKTDLEALITIVKEAEENESVLRTMYINTVNATDEKINLPSIATWNEILSQIPNIHSDKKAYHYMGGTASFENSAPYTMLNGNSVDFYFISVNISFKPSSYIMYYTDLSNGQKGMVVYNLESNNFSVADTIQRFSNITDSSATDVTFRNFKANSRGIQFYDAGTLRIPINAASGSCEYTLYAYS